MHEAVKKKKARRRPPRSALVLRWLAVGGIVLVALLYYRPLRTYVEKRHEVAQRQAELSALRAASRLLEQRAADSGSVATVERQARRLGLVKPGERLFIVKGIAAWQRARSTIEHGGR